MTPTKSTKKEPEYLRPRRASDKEVKEAGYSPPVVIKDAFSVSPSPVADECIREVNHIICVVGIDGMGLDEAQEKAEKAIRTLLAEKERKIDHSIDVRYEPDLIKMFDKFIEKWCGDYSAHLLDDDENDGQFIRERLVALAEKEKEVIERLAKRIKDHLELNGEGTDGVYWISQFELEDLLGLKQFSLEPDKEQKGCK